MPTTVGSRDAHVNNGVRESHYARAMDRKTTFAQRIEEARGDAGLSVIELCRRVKVSRNTYYQWTGERQSVPEADTMFALADALNVTARWLATGKSPKARLLGDLTQEQIDIAIAWPHLSPHTRLSISQLINADVAARIPLLQQPYASINQDDQERASRLIDAAQQAIREQGR